MKMHAGDDQFEVYRLKSQDHLLVAIPVDYIQSINNAIKEFGNIDSIPADRTVRGVFLKNENGTFELNKEGQQNDIVINQIILK